MAITLTLLAGLVLSGGTVNSARADNPSGLSPAEFAKLHKELQAPREAWQSIPWKLSILDARDQAAKEKKPVYMLVRSGHPLGCV
jgi:hypothetical protein